MAVAILTHGEWYVTERADKNENIVDRIQAYDGPLTLEKLTSPFRVKNCHPTLEGKQVVLHSGRQEIMNKVYFTYCLSSCLFEHNSNAI